MKFLCFLMSLSALLLLLGVNAAAMQADVICPDKHSKCPTGTTCCDMGGGVYGCCPMPNAVCCSDHLHCCPADTRCDLQHQQCLDKTSHGSSAGPRAQPWHSKFAARPHTPAEESSETAEQHRGGQAKSGAAANDVVVCPDGKHYCPAHTTCCPTGSGRTSRREFWRKSKVELNTGYSCCPAEDAVCCDDHQHCCPHGSQCDEQQQACVNVNGGKNHQRQHPQPMLRHSPHSHHQRNVEQLLKEMPAQLMEQAVRPCGGGGATKQSVCPADSKCCRHHNPLDGHKSDGCCPFANGQCCAHSAHCCPQGFACAAEEGRCISEQQSGVTLSTQMFPTQKAIKRRVSSTQPPKSCPDGTVCNSPNDTCCPRQATGDSGNTAILYDCCQHEKANCCANKLCCPAGYKCSGEAGCKQMNIREMIAQLFFSN